MTLETDLPTQTNSDLSVDLLDDRDLLELTRQGSEVAFAALYDRYVYPARRLARHLGQREESDDVVAEAFAQILDLLQRGKGPDRAFRAYLFTIIRNDSARRSKANGRVMPTDDESTVDRAVPFGGGELDEFEKSAIRSAFESLPERWRTALWHLDVEGRGVSDLAGVMNLKPNSVSALVYRARSGLREAYLREHIGTPPEPLSRVCASTRDRLTSVVRRTASAREQEKVHAHLNTCVTCMDVYLALRDINRDIGAILTPAAVAGAIGGGAVLVGTSSGGAVLAQVLAVAKGLAVATVPVAAVSVIVVGVVESKAPDAQMTPVPAAARPAPDAVPAADSGSTTDPSSTEGNKAASAPDKLPAVLPAGAAPGFAPSAAGNSQPGAAPASTTPTQPVPSRPTPNRPTVVAVEVDRDAVEVSLGPTKVSTDDVKETIDKLVQLPKDLLSGLVPAPER